MKIAIECRSHLLQKSLENFLRNHLGSQKSADIIIRDFPSDEKRSFYISATKEADLQKPFSKSQLILALQNHFKKMHKDSSTTHKKSKNTPDFTLLEQRIEMLTQEYQTKLLKTIKEFYG